MSDPFVAASVAGPLVGRAGGALPARPGRGAPAPGRSVAPGRDDPADGWGFETRAVRAGKAPDPGAGAVVARLRPSTPLARQRVGNRGDDEYVRTGNPSRTALETCLASLEGARYGFAFASGLAADDAVLRGLPPGAGVALGGDAGGGTFRLIDKVYGASGHPWTAVDLTDPGALARAWPEGTMLVWAETPTNPTTGVVDIAAVAEVVHAHGARLAVDNTLATPYLQQPLALGADLVVHSTTGYLGGQSDVVVGFAAVNDADLAAGLDLTRSAVGSVPSPVDCVLVQRGVRTLAVRMDRHCANAAAVAEALAGHRAVERVLWPGLPDHPGHDVARRQMRDFGGMVSFLARGGAPAAAAFCARTEVFSPAGSLAALESLVEHPARRPAVPVGGSPQPVPPGLVRLSVGIESAADLAADVRQALDGLA